MTQVNTKNISPEPAEITQKLIGLVLTKYRGLIPCILMRPLNHLWFLAHQIITLF